MNTVYTILYVNIDCPANSEVLGVYHDKDIAIDALIKAAHYSTKNGKLYQYLRESNDFSSFEELRKNVAKDMFLVDEDIYRIMEVVIV